MSTGRQAAVDDRGRTGNAGTAVGPVHAVAPVLGPIPDPDPASQGTSGRGLKLPFMLQTQHF